jgi:predicted MFS family arabinose efflux permease
MTGICSASDDARSSVFETPPIGSIPLPVYAFGAGIFAMTTAEFMVAGLMPELASAFGVTTAQVGYLISIYSAGMVVAGPVLTIGLLRFSRKTALIIMMAAFVLGQALAASAASYGLMASGRFVTGASSAAFFAVSLSAAADMVGAHARGRAASVVLAGLMLATVLGVPIATALGQHLDWRTSFWTVAGLVAVCTGIVSIITPRSPRPERIDLPAEFRALVNGRLWAAYATSGLIIAATFAAFSYFSPIFIEISDFPPSTIPYLFAAYGAATVVGNIVVGRLADRYTIPVLLIGLGILTITLMLLGLLAHVQTATIGFTVVLGLVGVTMNPAMAARVMRAANPRPLVNSVHGAIISLGVLIGSWLGGLAISAGMGLLSPVWIGTALAILGLLSLSPRKARSI